MSYWLLILTAIPVKRKLSRCFQALKTDKHLQEVLDIALQTEEETTVVSLNTTFSSEVIPMLQKAAISGENICAVLCEIFILHRRQLPYDEEWLLNTARRKDWLKPGEPLYIVWVIFWLILVCSSVENMILR